LHNATHVAVITHLDLVDLGANATGTIAIAPMTGAFPARTYVGNVKMLLDTPFTDSDASLNSLLVEVGDGGDTDRLLGQTQILGEVTEVITKTANANSQPYAYEAADTVDALFTAAGGASPTLAEITAGKLRIFLEIRNMADLPNPK